MSRIEYRFRPVRGGLNEALVRQASFYDIFDLYRYVAFCVCDPPVSLSDIYTERYCDIDDRIGWCNIHIVMVKKASGNYPIGYVSFNPSTRFGTLYHDDIVLEGLQ